MNVIFRVREFLKYQWKAKTKYYLHSPFVYQFFLNVLEGPEPAPLKSLLAWRRNLSESDEELSVKDYGTGNATSRKLPEMERHVAVRHKYGRLLYRLAAYFSPEYVLELGTSVGISSAYISLAVPNSKMVSLEGSPALAEAAIRHHAELEIRNVELVTGNFDDTLRPVLEKLERLDMVFFDGNHRYDATLNYFNQCVGRSNEKSVFVLDDIHYSPEMKAAWEKIKQHEKVSLTIDVFQFGIVFFRKDKIAKEHFVLRY